LAGELGACDRGRRRRRAAGHRRHDAGGRFVGKRRSAPLRPPRHAQSAFPEGSEARLRRGSGDRGRRPRWAERARGHVGCVERDSRFVRQDLGLRPARFQLWRDRMGPVRRERAAYEPLRGDSSTAASAASASASASSAAAAAAASTTASSASSASSSGYALRRPARDRQAAPARQNAHPARPLLIGPRQEKALGPRGASARPAAACWNPPTLRRSGEAGRGSPLAAGTGRPAARRARAPLLPVEKALPDPAHHHEVARA
jgi:hypothetical protein